MNRNYTQRLVLLLILSILPSVLFALTFSLPKSNNNIVGNVKTITMPYGEDITDIGQKYQVGYFEFLEANPDSDLDNLFAGTKLVVPTRYILPSALHKGVVINLAELRLYYYPPGGAEVMTFPIGIGRKGELTPLMKTKIIDKREDPIWTPTALTRQQELEKGIVLPRFIEAGPQNPLGKFSMRLGFNTYLIHGTNDPSGVGIRSSGGCIRMYPNDISKLFPLINVGTSVNVVNQPFKAGWRGNTLYLEAHVPIGHKRGKALDVLTPVVQAIMQMAKKRQHVEINWEKAMTVADQQRGIPEPIGHLASSK